jgi:hypothetical protein
VRNLEEENKKATKECPKCRTDIPLKATKCPNCQSDLRSWFRRHPVITGILCLVLLIVLVSALGENNDSTSKIEPTPVAKKVDNSGVPEESISPTEVAEKQNGEFAVGDTVIMRDWEVKVNKVSKEKSISYSTAKTNKEYVLVNITLKNNGEGEAKGTGALDFKVQDSNGVQDDKTFITLDDEMQGYVDLAPGGVLTGTIPFEVPENDNGLKLIFQPNFWLDNQRVVINLQ